MNRSGSNLQAILLSTESENSKRMDSVSVCCITKKDDALIVLFCIGAGDGNRTHVTSLGSWSSAIELHPPASVIRIRSSFKRYQEEKWSGRRDSDSRHPPWQGGTLPLSYYRTLHQSHPWKAMVRTKRLELLRRKAPEPKSGASAIPPRPH